MITFEKLQFKPHDIGLEFNKSNLDPRLHKYRDAIHATMKLENGYTVSVVNGTIFNCGNKNLYELAYWNDSQEMEVQNGYSKDELMEKINEVNSFKTDFALCSD